MTRIAIVDDNTAICSFLEDILVKSGEKYNIEKVWGDCNFIEVEE